jgi:acyl carrier protein
MAISKLTKAQSSEVSPLTLHERLTEVFRRVFHNEALVLNDDTSAVDVPGWDSVAHINLMFSIEEAFGVKFTGSELAEPWTVGELKTFLRNKGCAYMMWLSAISLPFSALCDASQLM